MNVAPQSPSEANPWSAGETRRFTPGPQPPFPGGSPQWSSHGPHPQGSHPPAAPPRSSRLPSGAEALGWGGGLTTLVGVVAVTWDFWAAISGWPLVLLLLVATAVLGVAAAVVADLDRAHDDQLAANLSAGLWWMTGIAASVSTYVATDVLSGGRAYLPLLAAAGAATAIMAAVAHRTRRDSALAGTVLGAAVTAFAGASLASIQAPVRALAVWGIGVLAVFALTAWNDLASRTAYATALTVGVGAAEAVLIAGGGTTMVVLIVLAMTAAAGMAVWRRTTGEGLTTAVLALLLTCQVLYDLAPQVFNLSTTVLLSGIAMTAGCIHLVRRSARSTRGRG